MTGSGSNQLMQERVIVDRSWGVSGAGGLLGVVQASVLYGRPASCLFLSL